MSLIIMNFINSAMMMGVISMIGFSCLADEEFFDFDRIKTTHGRTYEKIFVISADSHGLMFRHETGIAKLSFSELPMNLRMLYEPAESDADLKTEDSEVAVEEEVKPSNAPVYVTYIVRPVYQINETMPNYCRTPAQYWPNHWPRYHPAHALAHAPHRELVVRDFLYTTGLACKPPGVVTRRLPYRRPYLMH